MNAGRRRCHGWSSGPRARRCGSACGANLAQFTLLVVVNAFVGAMVGLERSILPAIAEQDFHLAARAAVLSFIVVFGVTKALTNYLAGRFSDAVGRKTVLVAGWLVATPVPFLLMWAPSWAWVLFANVLLGVSQGLTWSTTVIMKIDLAGPERRGLAMGLNEFAGYLAVALSALATGHLAAAYGLRPQPFYLGVGFVVIGLVPLGDARAGDARPRAPRGAEPRTRRGRQSSQRQVFLRTSFTDRELSAVSQAGLVNNLNDGMAWGLFPLFFAAAGMSLRQIGWLAAIYPGVWGMGQLVTGALSDSHRPQVAHRRRDVGPGGRHRRRGPLQRASSGFARRRRAARRRDRHGLSRRSSPRSATSPTRPGEPRRWASTGSGAISATRWARCSPA